MSEAVASLTPAGAVPVVPVRPISFRMPTSKQVKERLRAQGLWVEFLKRRRAIEEAGETFRNAKRQAWLEVLPRLESKEREAGELKAEEEEADREARIEAAAEKYERQDAEREVFGISLGEKLSLKKLRRLVDPKHFKAPECTDGEALEWVKANLNEPQPDPATCPGKWAWTWLWWLREERENLDGFMAKQQGEAMKQARGDDNGAKAMAEIERDSDFMSEIRKSAEEAMGLAANREVHVV